MPVSYHPGRNIVDDDADILVNTVNSVGVMGKGVALAFAKKWPEIVPPYHAACRRGEIRAGTCSLHLLGFGLRPISQVEVQPIRWWAALATKDHWRDPSRIEWVESGIAALADGAKRAGARSIAIPPPGCGNGGLDWREVEPIVLRHLGAFDLRIYGERTCNLV